MDKSKKILIVSFAPVILTIIFILYAVAPAVGNYSAANNDYMEEKTAYIDTQNQLNTLKENKSLAIELANLREKLADFDTQIPENDDLAILLVDLQKFAKNNDVKVLSLDADPESPMEIIDPKVQKLKEKKKNKILAKEKENTEPVQLYQIPLKLVLLGHYKNILNYINTLELYGRKITLDGILVTKYKTNKNSSEPALEVTINCTVYKLERMDMDALLTKNEDKSK